MVNPKIENDAMICLNPIWTICEL